ncbi:transporter [Flavobacterium sp. NKUCC04_CG]|uniref:transporter n=1 Tax=Flavobacterium sp. NKUCC04_CG TaxID=2842121 RepID=UPI001C5B9879|nr:transporter [Flavobacterium sp. NKUCC04_CG]MBW3519692.1 transporter [Flavobacterium sp. NKUCC04_CG]
MLQKLTVLLALLFTCVLQAQHTSEINSNRPSQSMGAFSVGKTVLQLEAGATYHDDPVTDHVKNQYAAELQLRYGAFFESLELVADFNFAKQHFYKPVDGQAINTSATTGFSNIEVGAKYLIYDPFKNYEEKINIYSWKANQRFKWRRLIPAVAVYAAATSKPTGVFSSPEEPEISPKVILIAQQHFSEKWALITNLIADKISSEEFRGYSYIVTLTHGINNHWSVFAENQGYKNDFYKEMNYRVGTANLIDKNMQIDLAAGMNQREGHASFFAQVGLSWRFDKNHRDVELK